MKIRTTLLLLLALCCSMYVRADENESNHVEVILSDSTRVEGYWHTDFKTGVKRVFSKTGSINQYITIKDSAKDGESRTYKAPEVIEYRFLEPSEEFPEGTIFVSEEINTPGMFKPNRSVRGFALLLYRSEGGSIMKWQVFESTGGRNSVSRLVPAIGVKFKGARAAYMFMMNGRHYPFYMNNYLKKAAPEFKKYLEEYFDKSPDKKAHQQELKDNPAILISLYEEYLKTQDPINDPAE